MQKIETDYLVIGTGAVSMTFVDTMLDESDATFVMVDRHHLPGGHWNDAYSFVRLHQPSSFYGVASTELGSNRIDDVGPNKGYYDLASGAEISAYFEKLMRERFLPSGRVKYFPMCHYDGRGQFHSLLSDEQYEVTVGRKTVDGTYYQTSVPSTHTRKFDVATDVACVAPNELPRLAAGYKQFAVLGGGKTAMDTCVWLLENGARPDSITWVCPRDSWVLNRLYTQPGIAFYKQVMEGNLAMLEAMGEASSVDDLFDRLETAGNMLRIDQSVRPEMYHYATLSEGEIAQLRRIETVIRGQRVARIAEGELVMQSGDIVEIAPQTLCVDCTASAVPKEKVKTKPIFEADLITLQPLFAPLVTYSAAVAAYVEANVETDSEKNSLCTPVVLADRPEEWMASTLGNFMNGNAWSQHKGLKEWIKTCRLNPTAAAFREGAGKIEEYKALSKRMRQGIGPAVVNTQRLISELTATEQVSSTDLVTGGGAADFLINRSDIRDAKFVQVDALGELKPNQIRCRIDTVALTANNITYAVTGDMLKYWDFFPAKDGWGKLPVWGFADVADSAHPEIAEGERIYGFWPLATHLTLDVDKVRPSRFVDVAPHRQHLNGLYNSYTRTANNPGFMPAFEHLNALLRPLFTTSFLIDDFLADSDFFGADAVIISSASSKTAIGTAFQLFSNRAGRESDVTVIGLTSPRNVAFVEELACYDQVVTYDEVANLSADTKVAYIDIAGNGELRRTIHHHFGENVVQSSSVGFSHWEAVTTDEALPGAQPSLFFAPAQAQKRLKEWGSAQFAQKTGMAGMNFFQMMAQSLDIVVRTGSEDIAATYDLMVEGDVVPKQAFILSLK